MAADSHGTDKTPLAEALEFAERWKGVRTDEAYGPAGKIMGLLSRELLALHAARSETRPTIDMPEGLDPSTARLVVRFAQAMAEKLRAAEVKYGYSNLWLDDDWMDECRAKLREHLEKGDPRDVANYCAFLWHHGESTAGKSAPCVVDPQVVEWLYHQTGHHECEDGWYSCATLTFDEHRRSEECDCGADDENRRKRVLLAYLERLAK